MKSTLLMRMQGMEQEVCQLFFAALCRKIDSKWQEVAENEGKTAKTARIERIWLGLALQCWVAMKKSKSRYFLGIDLARDKLKSNQTLSL